MLSLVSWEGVESIPPLRGEGRALSGGEVQVLQSYTLRPGHLDPGEVEKPLETSDAHRPHGNKSLGN